MRCSHLSLFVFMVVAIMLGQVPASGDITPMDFSPPPTGGGVSPKLRHSTIRLDDQEVIIRLKDSTYTVDAVFHVFNTGQTTTEWIGFPKNGRTGPRGSVRDFIRFEVWVNEKRVPFEEKFDLIQSAQNLLNRLRSGLVEQSMWLMGQGTFPGHTMTTVRVNYEAYYGYCGSYCNQAVYIYGTGGYWKDRIRNAAFIIDCTGRGGVTRVRPAFFFPDTQSHLIRRRLISENVVRYEVRDFEPDPRGTLSIPLLSGPEQDGGINELVSASKNGRLEHVRSLLEKGADVNAKGSMGETPLMAAASAGSLPVVKLLLEKGADVNAKTNSGRTALNLAGGKDIEEIEKVLKAYGAKE